MMEFLSILSLVVALALFTVGSVLLVALIWVAVTGWRDGRELRRRLEEYRKIHSLQDDPLGLDPRWR